VARARKKNTPKLSKRGKASDKQPQAELAKTFRKVFVEPTARHEKPQVEGWIGSSLAEQFAEQGRPSSKKPGQYRKPAQEKAIRKISEVYPDGAGDESTAEVCRKTGCKWDTVHRALGRKK